MLGSLSAALRSVTGCAKTYAMQFSEDEGFEHLHVHLVPRMADQPADLKGPNVFGYLTDDEADGMTAAERRRAQGLFRNAEAPAPHRPARAGRRGARRHIPKQP